MSYHNAKNRCVCGRDIADAEDVHTHSTGENCCPECCDCKLEVVEIGNNLLSHWIACGLLTLKSSPLSCGLGEEIDLDNA